MLDPASDCGGGLGAAFGGPARFAAAFLAAPTPFAGGGDAAGFGILGVAGFGRTFGLTAGGGDLGAAFGGPARFASAFLAATGRRRIAVGSGLRRAPPRSTTAGGGIFTEAAFFLKANARFRPPRGPTPGASAG